MELNAQIQTAVNLPAPPTGADLASAEDYAICRQIMHHASKNYSTASRYLPADRLPHVEALYALMRVGDDRVDVSHDGFASPKEAIDDWEQSYWHAFERGESPHPVLRAYLNTAVTFCIPADTMAAYFRAMREDLSIKRFPTFQHLLHYMDGSAVPVGRAMTHILGTRSPYTLSQALPGADALSIGMQLSNFWRDIGEDWQIGRVYLPQEDMHAFCVQEAELAQGKITPNLIDLLEYEFTRTEQYYLKARNSVPMLASGRWAVMTALEIYRAILFDIRRNGYNVFTRRAGTSKAQKMGLAVKSLWTTRV